MYDINELIKRYPELESCKNDIQKAFEILKECFENGHKLLIAGNGGSAADADHIVGELMKGFLDKRPLDEGECQKLEKVDSINGRVIASKLQKGLPAIALHNHNSLNTAFINDIDNGGEYFFAQQLFVYGQEGDVLLGISTSGNAKNIYNACVTAKMKNIKVITLTGESGGVISSLADSAIMAPAKETFIVQEYHLPIYHCLCLMLEKHFFNS